MTRTAAPPVTAAKKPVGDRLPPWAGFWIIALAFGAELAFCAVPTPLYAIYQQREGFPTVVLTVVFAAYAVGVMLSLYLAGHVSDRLGRRPVILGSLLVNLLAAVLFLVRNDVAGLIAARFVSGLGIGILTATATAHLSELGAAAGHSKDRVALVSTFANLGGIGLGPLIGGVIATWSTRPLVVPFVSFGILLSLAGILVAFVPETVERLGERPAYRPQRVAVPAAGRGAFFAAGAAAFGAFAVFGTFMGLSSTFLVGLLGWHSHLLAGLAPFVVFMAAALAQTVTGRMAMRPQLGLAVALAVVGLAGLGVAAVVASLPLFLVGGGVTGAGVGMAFRAALATVAAVTDAEHRGEALAGTFLIAYAGMTIPPLLTAAALSVWPVVDVLVGLVALAAVLVTISGSQLLRTAASGAGGAVARTGFGLDSGDGGDDGSSCTAAVRGP